MNYLDSRLHGAQRRAAAESAIASARASLEHDSFGRSRDALAALDGQLSRTPGEQGLLAFDTYAQYAVLARFGSDSAVAGRARTRWERFGAVGPSNPYRTAARLARDVAVGRADNAHGADPRDPLIGDLVTLSRLDGDDAAASLESARAAAAAHPTPRSRFLLARALYAHDQRADAIHEAEALAMALPDHAGARLLLARIYADRPETQERAVAVAGEVEAMGAQASVDERVEAATLVGQTDLALDRVTLARQAYERALQIDPRSPTALVGMAKILYRQGS